MLLDECVPRRLRRELPGHDIRTVSEMGWSGIKNGPLLHRAAQEFDVFLTVDLLLTALIPRSAAARQSVRKNLLGPEQVKKKHRT